MGRPPGHVCQVYGCSTTATFVAFLGDEHGMVTEYGPGGTESEDIHVCQDDAARLGEPEVVVSEWGEEPWRSVTIDPAKAEGWRLVVELNRGGGSRIVLYPPGAVVA